MIDKASFYKTSGHIGGAAVRISKDGDQFKASELWKIAGDEVANHWSTPVYFEGHLYGIFGFRKNYMLKCIDIKDGKEKWKGPETGRGGLIIADGMLLVQGENLQGARFSVSDRGLRVEKTHVSENGHWAELWLSASPEKAETVTVVAWVPAASFSVPTAVENHIGPYDGPLADVVRHASKYPPALDLAVRRSSMPG